jgi:PPOX class probable F420-dependent enzyme
MPADQQIGKGVDLRAQVRMSDDEVDAYLHEHSAMSLASLNADGTIHLVAMWYSLVDGKLAFQTKAKSQKAVNLRRDPTVTCLVESGDVYNDLRGVQIVGTAEVFDEPDRLLELGKTIYARRFGRYTDAALPTVQQMMRKRVGVIVHPERVASWDHTKL